MIIKLYFVISLCESEDNMVPTISDTNPGHGPGLESGDHSDRGTSHRTPVVQVSRDIPRVMSTPNHNFRPCRGPSKLHYNLSTDDEEIEACPVTQGGRDKARHGAGIRWERDITYSPRYPAYDEGRDYRMGRSRRSYTPSDESDGYRRRYAHRTPSSDDRRMKEREWYYRHEIEDRDILGRSRDSCFKDTGSHRLRRQYTRCPSPYAPLSHGSRPPQEMLRESASKRHSAGGVDTTDMMKGENLSNYNTPKKMFLSSLTLKTESIMRRERMAKQVEREVDMEKRMQAEERRTHINVNEDGKPYGLGLTAWNDAFGNALSSYRHELIKMIQAQEERQAWVKENVWEKVKELESSEKFRVKSEQMRYANSCRRTKGRIGPLGEVGITERLRRQLGRHPDPEEVQEEMRRDKGYSGRVRSVHPTRGLEDTGTYREAEKALNSKSLGPSISMRSPLSHMCNQAHVLAAVDNICEETLPQEPDNGEEEDGILKSNEEPLIRILMQQIEDLKKVKSGNPGDVNIVIMPLMQQVLNLREKNASTD
ncbi:hypothetical protein M758_UG238100 [Ceratodon purpureus]|nr:hypothetical protein M758_UG238100 [Ceratodon purpureus]